MLLFGLFISWILIIGAYWKSYDNLLKQIDGPKSEPQFNLIIMAGDILSSNGSEDDKKTQFKENSAELTRIFDENINKYKDYPNSVSSDFIDTKNTVQTFSAEEIVERFSEMYPYQDIHVVIQKCHNDVCHLENLTLPRKVETKKPIAKVTSYDPVVIFSNKYKPTPLLKMESTTQVTVKQEEKVISIWKYLEKIAAAVVIIVTNGLKTFFTYLKTSRSLAQFLIVLNPFLILIYCAFMRKSTYNVNRLQSDGEIPKVQSCLSSIVKNLHDISLSQEKVDRWEAIKKQLRIVDAMHSKVLIMEEELSKERLEFEDEIMLQISNQNEKVFKVLKTLNEKESKQNQSIKEEKQVLKLLFEKEKRMLKDVNDKISYAEIVVKKFIRDLHKLLAKEINEKRADELRQEIAFFEKERENLVSFYEKPEFAKLAFSNTLQRPCSHHLISQEDTA